MKTSYQQAIEAVLEHEGGYVHHPKDPGGATNRGIIQAVYNAYQRQRRPEIAPNSVKYITDAEVYEIYRLQYWNAVRGDELPAGIDYCTFDYGVNSGPSRAIKCLQAALGVKTDGLLGLATLQKAKDADAALIVQQMCDKRLAFLKGLKTWDTFGKGWGRRVDGVRKLGLQLASRPSQMPVQPAPHTPSYMASNVAKAAVDPASAMPRSFWQRLFG